MKELLLKYINGDCSDQEKVEITKWLTSDPENMKEYLALRKLIDITIWQADAGVQLPQKSGGRFSVNYKIVIREFLKVAAVFAIAFLIFRYLFPGDASSIQEAQMQTLHVPAGQRAEVTLQDGTKVWLNANSTLTFPTQFSKEDREVNLDGEGYFEVAHNKSQPFIVNTKQYDVRVWGTKFNLNAYSGSGRFLTSLLEGSVELMEHGDTKGVMLKPNEEAYLRENKIIISPIRDKEHLLWRDGIISLDDVTFTELIHNLELYFDLTIEVDNNDPSVLDAHYSGKFRMKDGVEHILKVLQLKTNFEFKFNEERNKITIE